MAAPLVRLQDQNTSGSTFGGHVLREAFEAAFAAAAMHSGAPLLAWAMLQAAGEAQRAVHCKRRAGKQAAVS